MSERNKQVVLAYVETFNRADIDALCPLFTPDALVYGVLGWVELEKVKPVWQEIMRCFNINLQVESVIAEGDMVAVRYTERGKSVPRQSGHRSFL